MLHVFAKAIVMSIFVYRKTKINPHVYSELCRNKKEFMN